MVKEIKIEEIKGFKIGQESDHEAMTGCTVILCEEGAVAGVDVRGGGPATRETDLLRPTNMVQEIHAVMLSGGSAYGLDACSGAMAYLEEQGVGFDVGVGVVPIVCGASLFDLGLGSATVRPDKAMGYRACEKAGGVVETGSVGAGTGATVGKLLGMDYATKSGIGTYAVKLGDLELGAIVAVNALGDIVDGETGEILAGLLTEDKKGFRNSFDTLMEGINAEKNVFTQNTTIGCLITNAKLTKTQANRVASVAHNGYARSIRPVHTSADGDAIFVMGRGEVEVNTDALGALAAKVMAEAVRNSIRKQEGEGERAGWPTK